MARKKKETTPEATPEATPEVQEQTPATAPEATPEVQEQTPATAPEATAPMQEAPAPQEGHLDPEQFKDMDDATLQGLAHDLGLDPAAYKDRDAMIAAIAEVPVIPGPPEAEPVQEEPAPEEPAPEPPADTTPAPEPVPAQEDPAPAPEPTPEITPDQEPEAVPAPEDAPEEDQDPEPDPAGERHTPYKAVVAVSLAVVHREVGLGTADMLKAVGSLRKGETVTVTGRKGTYAQLKNGLYILEALLEVAPPT